MMAVELTRFHGRVDFQNLTCLPSRCDQDQLAAALIGF